MLLTISSILFGPSVLLGLQSYIFLFYIGQAFNGLGAGMIYTPILPEIIDSVYYKEGIIEGEDENLDAVLADKASGVYMGALSVGVIIAPSAGSFVYDNILNKNWELTCDVFAIFGAIYTLIFIVFNTLPDLSKEKQQNEEMENKIAKSEIVQIKLGLITPDIILEETEDTEDGADESHASIRREEENPRKSNYKFSNMWQKRNTILRDSHLSSNIKPALLD